MKSNGLKVYHVNDGSTLSLANDVITMDTK